MKAFRQAAIVGALALAPAVVTAFRFPYSEQVATRPHEIALETVRTWNSPILWIDARTEADYHRAHVPEAISLNAANWERQLPAVIDAWRPEMKVVVYCDGLACAASEDIARRLRDEVGLAEVAFLQGGWDAWRRATK